jgi:hypothetical protein
VGKGEEMKTISIQHVGVSSFGKLVGTWHAIVGLFTGVFVAISASINFVNTSDLSVFTEVLLSIAIVVGSITLIPVFAFLIGWINGAITALVLNLVVGTSGGLEVDIEDVKTK